MKLIINMVDWWKTILEGNRKLKTLQHIPPDFLFVKLIKTSLTGFETFRKKAATPPPQGISHEF